MITAADWDSMTPLVVFVHSKSDGGGLDLSVVCHRQRQRRLFCQSSVPRRHRRSTMNARRTAKWMPLLRISSSPVVFWVSCLCSLLVPYLKRAAEFRWRRLFYLGDGWDRHSQWQEVVNKQSDSLLWLALPWINYRLAILVQTQTIFQIVS